MKEESAMDFYLFSVLGKVSSDPKDELVKAAIDRAYRDASSRVSYCADDEERRAKTDELEKRIRALSEVGVGGFPEWHKETCKHILPETPGEGDGYGKAQKWLNMTMKYLSTMNALVSPKNDEFKDFYGKIAKFERSFHIPVDSYVIQALCYLDDVSPSRESELGLPYKKEKLPKRKAVCQCASPHDYVKAWSTWTEEDYDCFREKLGDRLGLEWEGAVWPLVAKYRSAVDSLQGEGAVEEKEGLREGLIEAVKKVPFDGGAAD